MFKIVEKLPTLKIRYSTCYGVPVWRSRVSRYYYAVLHRRYVVCVDSECFNELIDLCRIYKRA